MALESVFLAIYCRKTKKIEYACKCSGCSEFRGNKSRTMIECDYKYEQE